MNINYDEVALLYPASPTTFPHVWRNHAHDMIPPRFAIWFPDKANYQIYDIRRNEDTSVILTPTRTQRENPFYFAIQNEGDRRSRTVTIYNPRASINTHSNVALWFTGAWLCKKHSSNNLQAVLPILGTSDLKPFKYVSNVGMYPNYIFVEWVNNYTPEYIRNLTHNRMVFSSLQPIEIEENTKPPTQIPEFVASALVKDAIQKGECCPISMEDLKTGSIAVTSCYHIFDRSSLQGWLTDHTTCPVCKQACVVTEV